MTEWYRKRSNKLCGTCQPQDIFMSKTSFTQQFIFYLVTNIVKKLKENDQVLKNK